MNKYKVSYRRLGGTNEEFVEAENEAKAIEKIQSEYDFSLTKIRAKKVYSPTIEDYHNMRETCIVLACVCLGLVIALMFK